MTATLWQAARGTGSVSAGASVYRAITNGFSSLGGNTTEANAKIVVRSAGVFSKLTIHVSSNNRGASTAKFRIGGVNGSESVSIGANSTGNFTDATGTDTVSAGDVVDINVTVGTGGSSFVDNVNTIIFTPASNTVQKVASLNSGVVPSGNGTYYAGWGGDNGTNTIEASVQYKVKGPCTLKNLVVYTGANTWAATVTVGNRKNGADGTVLVSIGASTTGTFEDTTHSDSLSSGSLIDVFYRLAAGSGSFTPSSIAADIVTTDSTYPIMAAGGASLASATTYYAPFGAYLGGTSSTEAAVQALSGIANYFNNLEAYVSSNTNNGTSTLKLRKDGADTALAISIGTGVTGYLEDATDSVTAISTSLLDYAIVTGGSSGALVLNNVGMLASLPVAVTVSGTSSLGGVTSSGTVTSVSSSTIYGTGTLRGVTGSGTILAGAIVSGSGDLDGSVTSGTFTESMTVSGTGSLPRPTSTGTILAGIVVDGTGTLNGITSSGTITEEMSVSGTGNLPIITSSGIVSTGCSVSGTGSLNGITSSGTLLVGPVVNGAGSLNGVTSSGTITESISISGTGVVFGTTSSGTISSGVSVSGTGTLPGVTSSGTTTESFIASGTGTVCGLTSTGIVLGGAIVDGTGSLYGLTSSGTFIVIGGVTINGTGAVRGVTSAGAIYVLFKADFMAPARASTFNARVRASTFAVHT